MNFREFENFIDIEDGRLKNCYGDYSSKENEVLFKMTKVTEEVGELCSEILAKFSRQRKEKLNSYSDEKLAEELIDIVITLSLLARSLDIDIEKTLIKKIEKIEKRHQDNKN